MHSKYLISLLLVFLFSMCAGKKSAEMTPADKSGSLNVTNQLNVSIETYPVDTLLFSVNETPVDIHTDSILFENNVDRELYFYKGKIYLNKKEILCYGNVMAFEQILYMQVNGRKYLYFYPGFFYFNPPEDDPNQEPEILRAWDDCGILIEFEKNGEYLKKERVPYADEYSYRDIPTLSGYFGLDTLDNNSKECLIYDYRSLLSDNP